MESIVMLELNDVLSIVDTATDFYYKKLQFGEISEAEYTVITNVLTKVHNLIETMAEESYDG